MSEDAGKRPAAGSGDSVPMIRRAGGDVYSQAIHESSESDEQDEFVYSESMLRRVDGEVYAQTMNEEAEKFEQQVVKFDEEGDEWHHRLSLQSFLKLSKEKKKQLTTQDANKANPSEESEMKLRKLLNTHLDIPGALDGSIWHHKYDDIDNSFPVANTTATGDDQGLDESSALENSRRSRRDSKWMAMGLGVTMSMSPKPPPSSATVETTPMGHIEAHLDEVDSLNETLESLTEHFEELHSLHNAATKHVKTKEKESSRKLPKFSPRKAPAKGKSVTGDSKASVLSSGSKSSNAKKSSGKNVFFNKKIFSKKVITRNQSGGSSSGSGVGKRSPLTLGSGRSVNSTPTTASSSNRNSSTKKGVGGDITAIPSVTANFTHSFNSVHTEPTVDLSAKIPLFPNDPSSNKSVVFNENYFEQFDSSSDHHEEETMSFTSWSSRNHAEANQAVYVADFIAQRALLKKTSLEFVTLQDNLAKTKFLLNNANRIRLLDKTCVLLARQQSSVRMHTLHIKFARWLSFTRSFDVAAAGIAEGKLQVVTKALYLRRLKIILHKWRAWCKHCRTAVEALGKVLNAERRRALSNCLHEWQLSNKELEVFELSNDLIRLTWKHLYQRQMIVSAYLRKSLKQWLLVTRDDKRRELQLRRLCAISHQRRSKFAIFFQHWRRQLITYPVVMKRNVTLGVAKVEVLWRLHEERSIRHHAMRALHHWRYLTHMGDALISSRRHAFLALGVLYRHRSQRTALYKWHRGMLSEKRGVSMLKRVMLWWAVKKRLYQLGRAFAVLLDNTLIDGLKDENRRVQSTLQHQLKLTLDKASLRLYEIKVEWKGATLLLNAFRSWHAEVYVRRHRRKEVLPALLRSFMSRRNRVRATAKAHVFSHWLLLIERGKRCNSLLQRLVHMHQLLRKRLYLRQWKRYVTFVGWVNTIVSVMSYYSPKPGLHMLRRRFQTWQAFAQRINHVHAVLARCNRGLTLATMRFTMRLWGTSLALRKQRLDRQSRLEQPFNKWCDFSRFSHTRKVRLAYVFTMCANASARQYLWKWFKNVRVHGRYKVTAARTFIKAKRAFLDKRVRLSFNHWRTLNAIDRSSTIASLGLSLSRALQQLVDKTLVNEEQLLEHAILKQSLTLKELKYERLASNTARTFYYFNTTLMLTLRKLFNAWRSTTHVKRQMTKANAHIQAIYTLSCKQTIRQRIRKLGCAFQVWKGGMLAAAAVQLKARYGTGRNLVAKRLARISLKRLVFKHWKRYRHLFRFLFLPALSRVGGRRKKRLRRWAFERWCMYMLALRFIGKKIQEKGFLRKYFAAWAMLKVKTRLLLTQGHQKALMLIKQRRKTLKEKTFTGFRRIVLACRHRRRRWLRVGAIVVNKRLQSAWLRIKIAILGPVKRQSVVQPFVVSLILFLRSQMLQYLRFICNRALQRWKGLVKSDNTRKILQKHRAQSLRSILLMNLSWKPKCRSFNKWKVLTKERSRHLFVIEGTLYQLLKARHLKHLLRYSFQCWWQHPRMQRALPLRITTRHEAKITAITPPFDSDRLIREKLLGRHNSDIQSDKHSERHAINKINATSYGNLATLQAQFLDYTLPLLKATYVEAMDSRSPSRLLTAFLSQLHQVLPHYLPSIYLCRRSAGDTPSIHEAFTGTLTGVIASSMLDLDVADDDVALHCPGAEAVEDEVHLHISHSASSTSGSSMTPTSNAILNARGEKKDGRLVDTLHYHVHELSVGGTLNQDNKSLVKMAITGDQSSFCVKTTRKERLVTYTTTPIVPKAKKNKMKKEVRISKTEKARKEEKSVHVSPLNVVRNYSIISPPRNTGKEADLSVKLTNMGADKSPVEIALTDQPAVTPTAAFAYSPAPAPAPTPPTSGTKEVPKPTSNSTKFPSKPRKPGIPDKSSKLDKLKSILKESPKTPVQVLVETSTDPIVTERPPAAPLQMPSPKKAPPPPGSDVHAALGASLQSVVSLRNPVQNRFGGASSIQFPFSRHDIDNKEDEDHGHNNEYDDNAYSEEEQEKEEEEEEEVVITKTKVDVITDDEVEAAVVPLHDNRGLILGCLCLTRIDSSEQQKEHEETEHSTTKWEHVATNTLCARFAHGLNKVRIAQGGKHNSENTPTHRDLKHRFAASAVVESELLLLTRAMAVKLKLSLDRANVLSTIMCTLIDVISTYLVPTTTITAETEAVGESKKQLQVVFEERLQSKDEAMRNLQRDNKELREALAEEMEHSHHVLLRHKQVSEQQQESTARYKQHMRVTTATAAKMKDRLKVSQCLVEHQKDEIEQLKGMLENKEKEVVSQKTLLISAHESLVHAKDNEVKHKEHTEKVKSLHRTLLMAQRVLQPLNEN